MNDSSFSITTPPIFQSMQGEDHVEFPYPNRRIIFMFAYFFIQKKVAKISS